MHSTRTHCNAQEIKNVNTNVIYFKDDLIPE